MLTNMEGRKKMGRQKVEEEKKKTWFLLWQPGDKEEEEQRGRLQIELERGREGERERRERALAK